jgi:hypothetical protein
MKRTVLAPVLVVATLFALGGCNKESAASGRSGTRLALDKPANQTIKQGDSNNVNVSVDRTGFGDAVKVSFSNLPAGVRVTGDAIPAGKDSLDFVLVAAPDAAIVDKQIVTVKATGQGIDLSQTFELTVKPKG